MEKPMRKLSTNRVNWDVNKSWIAEQISKLSGIAPGRDLIETPIKDNYTKEQTIFFSLEGSPARGFAIFTGDKKYEGKLCIISYGMDKKKIFNNIKVVGLKSNAEKGF